MKVFIYDKKDNHTVDVIDKVNNVWVDPISKTYHVETGDGAEIIFDTRAIKATAYQN